MYVFSTLTAPNTYAYGHAGFPDGISIRGGANVADVRTLVTSAGAYTKVTDEQMDALNDDPTFKLHKENGFITVRKSNRDDEEAVASDHVTRDAAAPLTPEDMAADGAKLAGTDDTPAAPPPPAPRSPRRA